jgi:AcrR family transcriptional regulator
VNVVTATKRKRMPRVERERQMIEIAEAVFAERGFAAASMDDIAEQVGVSKPMLYEYFNSKEGLMLACIRQSRAALRLATEQATAGAPDAEAALYRGLLAFFAFIHERRQAWSVLRQEMSVIGTPAADEVEEIRRQQTDLIAALMSTYFDGRSELQIEAAAEFVVGACDRLAIWCERHDEVSPEQATSYAMDVIWHGLAPRDR